MGRQHATVDQGDSPPRGLMKNLFDLDGDITQSKEFCPTPVIEHHNQAQTDDNSNIQPAFDYQRGAATL